MPFGQLLVGGGAAVHRPVARADVASCREPSGGSDDSEGDIQVSSPYGQGRRGGEAAQTQPIKSAAAEAAPGCSEGGEADSAGGEQSAQAGEQSARAGERGGSGGGLTLPDEAVGDALLSVAGEYFAARGSQEGAVGDALISVAGGHIATGDGAESNSFEEEEEDFDMDDDALELLLVDGLGTGAPQPSAVGFSPDDGEDIMF